MPNLRRHGNNLSSCLQKFYGSSIERDSLGLNLALDGIVAPLIDSWEEPAVGLADIVDLSDLPGIVVAQTKLLAGKNVNSGTFGSKADVRT